MGESYIVLNNKLTFVLLILIKVRAGGCALHCLPLLAFSFCVF